jgi:hypothetical protein
MWIIDVFKRKGKRLVRAIKNPEFRAEVFELVSAVAVAKATKSPAAIMQALDEAKDVKEAIDKIEDN